MKNLRIGIVGTNFISDWFYEAARDASGVQVEAVYSRKLDTGEAFAKKHGINSVYTNYDDMLSSGIIDAVYVASPTICHKEHTIKALRAGIAVLCEKMIAESYISFLEMKSESERSGIVLLEAMRPEFDPAYEVLRGALPRVGKIRRVALEFCQYSSRYDKFRAGIVENAFNPSLKNSALADIGIYPLHICISLFGAPKTVRSSSVKLENGFEGAGSAVLGYEDMIAEISYSKIFDSVNPSSIAGEDGTILIDKLVNPSEIILVKRGGEREVLFSRSLLSNMIYEIRAFREMVLGLSDFKPYLELSESVMRVVDDIYRISRIM